MEDGGMIYISALHASTLSINYFWNFSSFVVSLVFPPWEEIVNHATGSPYTAGVSECSLGLDAEDFVADLHESEHIDLGWDGGVLGLCEMELRVGQGHQG